MTSVAIPETVPRQPKPLFDWFFGFAVSCVIGIYIRAVYFTPVDALQGAAQKIYYLHVPAFLGAYIAVGITALLSIVYLWLHDARADRLASSSAEVALVFLCVGLTTGPLWAKLIWGAYWVWWDMRLTLALFLGFIVLAYVILRGAIEEDAMRARYSAVLGVLAALLIPFIHLSVYLFQARLHPMPIVLKPGQPSLSPEMLTTFLLSFCAFTIFCIALIRARYRLAELRERVAYLEGGV